MDFDPSPRSADYLARVRRFIAEQIAPVEPELWSRIHDLGHGGDFRSWTIPPAVEELKARARGEGAALTVAEYARAVLHNGLGDYRLAAVAADLASAAGELVISSWALYELVEAAVRSDDR